MDAGNLEMQGARSSLAMVMAKPSRNMVQISTGLSYPGEQNGPYFADAIITRVLKMRQFIYAYFVDIVLVS